MFNVCCCCCNILCLHLFGCSNYVKLVVVAVLRAYFSAATTVVFRKIFASVAAHANNWNEIKCWEAYIIVVLLLLHSKWNQKARFTVKSTNLLPENFTVFSLCHCSYLLSLLNVARIFRALHNSNNSSTADMLISEPSQQARHSFGCPHCCCLWLLWCAVVFTCNHSPLTICAWQMESLCAQHCCLVSLIRRCFAIVIHKFTIATISKNSTRRCISILLLLYFRGATLSLELLSTHHWLSSHIVYSHTYICCKEAALFVVHVHCRLCRCHVVVVVVVVDVLHLCNCYALNNCILIGGTN